MTFNVEYGGTVIDFDKIVEAVVKADADVVGLNEVYSTGEVGGRPGRLPLRRAPGWT